MSQQREIEPNKNTGTSRTWMAGVGVGILVIAGIGIWLAGSKAKNTPATEALSVDTISRETSVLVARDMKVRIDSGGTVVALFLPPGTALTPLDAAKYNRLFPGSTLPEGVRLDTRPGNAELALQHFGKDVEWPIVVVAGPRGEQVFSSPLDTTAIKQAVQAVRDQ